MTTELLVNISKNLYESDFCLWLETTVKLLRDHNFSELDLDNLIEEIEGMSRKEKQTLKSNLRVLLMHLIKWKYQSEKQTNSWKYTIREHRKRIQDAFINSPSLKAYYLEVFADSYQDAKELAADETGLNIDIFSITSPFTPEETLNENYLPN